MINISFLYSIFLYFMIFFKCIFNMVWRKYKNGKNGSIQDLKVALIYGNRNIDGINKDGAMEEIYKYEEDVHHYMYMQHFLKEHLIN